MPVIFNILSGFLLHLNLEHILLDFISLEVWKTWISDVNTTLAILFNGVVLDLRFGVTKEEYTTFFVLDNVITLNNAIRMEKDDAMLGILLDDVCLDEQILFALHNEDTFSFTTFD